MANLVETVQTWFGLPTQQNINGLIEQAVDQAVGSMENEFLRESYRGTAQAIMSFDEEGWRPAGSVYDNGRGFSLESIKQITTHAREVVQDNALLTRGLRLKNNHVFGRGFEFEYGTATVNKDGTLRGGIEKIINDPANQEVVFSNTAAKRNNKTLFESGNFFLVFDKRKKQFARMLIDNIGNSITYDDDITRVKYYLRQYTKVNSFGGAMVVRQEWIPLYSYDSTNPKHPKSINLPEGGSAPVRVDLVIIEHKANITDGQLWGKPDCLAAIPWAWAAGEFLRDGSKLFKAISTIAYHVKNRSEVAQKSIGAKLRTGRTGGIVQTGPDSEITQMPRYGNIDLYGARPIQAMAATALDVSVASLTSDVARGGGYASEQTLNLPEQLAALSRQEDWTVFYKQVFACIGLPDATINFKKLSHDTPYRMQQQYALAFETGGLKHEEYRELTLELNDVVGNPTDLPEPNEFTGSKASTLAKYLDLDKATAPASSSIPSQGNSGVGSMTDNNQARNDDRDDNSD